MRCDVVWCAWNIERRSLVGRKQYDEAADLVLSGALQLLQRNQVGAQSSLLSSPPLLRSSPLFSSPLLLPSPLLSASPPLLSSPPRLSSLLLSSAPTLPSPLLSSPILSSSFNSPSSDVLAHLISSPITSPHLISHLLSPHLISSPITSPHLLSSHLLTSSYNRCVLLFSLPSHPLLCFALLRFASSLSAAGQCWGSARKTAD